VQNVLHKEYENVNAVQNSKWGPAISIGFLGSHTYNKWFVWLLLVEVLERVNDEALGQEQAF
jgi:hypothetical protein